MNMRKSLLSSASACAILLAFAQPASAATCTATNDSEFDACVAGAANGDTIILTGAASLDASITASNLNLTVDAGGSLTDAGGSFGPSTAVTVNSGGSLATTGADTFASLAGAGTITTSSGGIVFGDANNTAFSGTWTAPSLSQYLFKQGTGTLTINGMTSTNGEFGSIAGTVVQSSGSTSIKSIQIGTGAAGNSIMNMSGGTLNLTGTGAVGAPCASQCPALRVGDFGGTGIMNHSGGSIVMGAPGGSFNLGNQGGIGTYNLSGGTLQLGVFGDVTSEGLHSIGRSTTDTRNSSGTLNISGTGLLDLQRGFLVNGDRDAAGSLATTSSTINQTGGTLRVRDGAFFYLSGYNNAGALDSVYNLNGGTLEIGGNSLQADYTGAGTNGAYQFNIGNGTIKVIDNALTVAANATLTGATAATGATIDTNGLGATWTGNLSGTGWLSKAGAGTLTLSGTNTFSGGLAVNAGTVATTGINAIGDTASVSIASGATLTLGTMVPGTFEIVGGLNMASGSTLNITTAGAGLVVGDLTDSAIAGTVNSPFGGFLGKAGPATMTINGLTMAEGDFYMFGGVTAHTAGTSTVKAPIVGTGAGFSATFTMSGGLLNVTGTCVLPGDSGCARMSVGDFGGTGVVNHTGGTIKVAGAVGVSPASFAVGNQGGDGTYNISGGVLQFGDAADPINSGLWNLGRSTASATDGTTNGTLNISGTGLVDVQTGDLVNGDRDAAIRAGGETTVSTINMTGGELRVRADAEFFLAGFNNNAAVDSTFNLNGGQLTIGGASLQEYYAGGTGVYQFNFGSGTILVSGSALTTTANATLTGATAATGGTINTNGLGANWNGVLSGSGWLVKSGAGTLNLGGTNTYTGGTAFNGGTVFADAIADLGALSAGLSFNGGTLQLGVADLLTTRTGAMALAGAGTIDTNGFNSGYAGAISGTGSLTKAGAGTLTLSGTNTHSGATNVNAGTLATSGGSAIGDASAVTVASGATLSLGANETIGSLAGAGSVGLGANTLTAGGNNGSTTFSGILSGTGGLTKAGTGTMTLSGANSYTGMTRVEGGTLLVGNVDALGDQFEVVGGSTLNLGGNSITMLSGVLQAGSTLSNGTLTTTLASPLAVQISGSTVSANLAGVGGVTSDGASSLSGNNTYTGATNIVSGTLSVSGGNAISNASLVNISGGATLALLGNETVGSVAGAGSVGLGAFTLTTGGDNTSTTLSGAVTGTGGLTKVGTGTFTLSGANTYSGATTISTGTLATSGGSAIGDTSAVTVASGATLSLGANETIGSLAGAGSVALAANTLTAGGNNGSTSFTGTTAGSGGFTKAGTGTLSTGNLAHTGLTTVSGGNLNVNGSVAGSVIVNSGGTLSGNTAIAGNLTLNAGGALSSGNSPGTTTVAGNFVGGGILNVEVQFNNAGAPVNGTTHDFLNITGNVTGVSTVNILAVAPSTAPTITTGNGIELVRVGGTTSAGAFALSGPVVQGGIQYLLSYLPDYSGTLDGYFLQATARDEIAGHVAILSAGRSMLARCNRGDERFGGPVGAGGKRAWAKFMGGSVDTAADTGLQTEQDFTCTAGGMDLASAGDLRLGLAGGFGDTSVDVTTAAGVSKIEGDQSMIEAQASYAMGSTFVNMTAGYAGTDWTHTGPVSGVKRATVDGLIGSLQVGQRWSLDEAWQLGLSGGVDYDGTSCTDSCLLAGVTAEESNWRGTVAAKLSGTTGKFRPYASIAYSDDLDGGNSVSLGGVSVAADTASSLLSARAGFDARVTDKVGLFVDAGMVEGLDTDVTGYDGQAGLRINW